MLNSNLGDGASKAATPRHVAVIMDGNGRWAQNRSLPRAAGHRKGVETVRDIVQAAGELGIEYFTLFSFSSENWSRPKSEIEILMALLKRFIQQDLSELHKNNVRVRIIGERDNLEPDIRALIEQSEDLTAGNTGLNLQVAFNYGARGEIVNAVRRLAEKVRDGEITPEEITADMLGAHLDTSGVPDPDLLIRTSGEKRLSNFLLWQCAYTELVFVDTLWPDFTRETLQLAIDEYHRRERRYGGLTVSVSG